LRRFRRFTIHLRQSRCLLVARLLQRLPRPLLWDGRISGLLKKTRLRLLEERLRSRIERIEGLAQSQRMKLLAPLMHGLRQRRADAAAFVAQQAR
jgi:hypothetical protein